MKLKEISRTAHISWSPSKVYPCYIATGTAAQQLDASFSTTACLEFHRLDLSNIEEELIIDASIQTESRFNKLLWNDFTNNIIIGGCENSSIYLYDFDKITSNKSNEAVIKLEKHTGTVGALDINPLQTNLLASGAANSEILIWDLNNPSVPNMPGAKQLPLDEIQSVAWNYQVPHILSSTCSGKCSVWDLRKNESIIKISDSTSKIKAKLAAWHPDVATQLCLSSEDDHSPQLQMWDLRFATAPVKTFNGHTRGVLTFAWSLADSDLLVSCGKDNRILCWNPNTNGNNVETVLEIPSSQWCFDVSWSTRYPHLISTASYESIISIYSLMGGKYDVKPETSNKIMDSFGVSSNGPNVQQPIQIQQQIIPQLKFAPKWMKRRCGVSFGFGGRLVTFGVEPQTNEHEKPKVSILQVVTDQKLVDESTKLENALQSGQIIEFCNSKLENVSSSNKEDDIEIWKFILESLNQDKKLKFVQSLGFDSNSIEEKFQEIVKLDDRAENSRSNSPIDFLFDNKTDNSLCELLLLRKYDVAVDLCINENRYADAILIASFAGKDLLTRTQARYFKNKKSSFSKFLESYLNQDWIQIVSNCNLNHWKEALAAVLSYNSDQDLFNLCNILGNRLENESKLLNACICYICSSNLNKLTDCWLKVKKTNDDNELSTILQDLIEKITILQYSIRNIHGEKIEESNSFNRILSQYSKLLAEQGCFLTALNYIKDSHDPSLLILKDRLFNALDSSVAHSYGISKPENPFKQTKQQQQLNPKTQARTPLGSSSSSSPSSTQKQQTFQFQPTNNIQPQPPAPQPQPMFSYNNQATQPQQTFTYNNSIPQQHKPFIPTQPVIPTIPAPIVKQPIQPPPLINNNNSQQQSPSNLFVPTNQTTTQPQPQTTLSYQDFRPSTAWNDPPIVQQKVKVPNVPKDIGIDQSKLFQPSNYSVPSIPYGQPATAPLTQPQIPNSNGYTTNPVVNNNTNFFNPINNRPNIQQNIGFNPIQNTPSTTTSNSPVPKVSAPVIEKQPIPNEYLNIQITFDDLLKRCLDLTTAPAPKRKLEDVAKKLELLYDKLRDRALSEPVIQGLQSIIQYIQAHDYQSSIQLHTHIVGTSNFSEISGFMPGVKVLIQSCQQLNVVI